MGTKEGSHGEEVYRAADEWLKGFGQRGAAGPSVITSGRQRTGEQSAAFLEPPDAALDDVAATVHFAVKVRMPRLGNLPAVRNDRLDVAFVEPVT